jgi:hypothetical protein
MTNILMCNRGFIATAKMHHTYKMLDRSYLPSNDVDKLLIAEIEIFIFAVCEENHKSDRRKSLVSKYEAKFDAKSIYNKLLLHAGSSIAIQISSSSSVYYNTSATYRGCVQGTSFEVDFNERNMSFFLRNLRLMHLLQNRSCVYYKTQLMKFLRYPM